MRLKIEGAGGTARNYRVWIDGVERHDVVSIILSAGVNEFTHATIEFLVAEGLDVDLDPPSDFDGTTDG